MAPKINEVDVNWTHGSLTPFTSPAPVETVPQEDRHTGKTERAFLYRLLLRSGAATGTSTTPGSIVAGVFNTSAARRRLEPASG